MRNDSPEQTPDFYVVLMGDGDGNRAKAATNAYEQYGAAPMVLAQTEASQYEEAGIDLSESQRNIRYLSYLGIPPEHLFELDKPHVTSTFEEAQRIRQWAETKFAGRDNLSFAVVSSWSHTKRAHWIFSRIWRDVPAVKIMTISSDATACATWWTDEESAFSVISEYIKWIYYLLKY